MQTSNPPDFLLVNHVWPSQQLSGYELEHDCPNSAGFVVEPAQLTSVHVPCCYTACLLPLVCENPAVHRHPAASFSFAPRPRESLCCFDCSDCRYWLAVCAGCS